jgi:hypothetical protein
LIDRAYLVGGFPTSELGISQPPPQRNSLTLLIVTSQCINFECNKLDCHAFFTKWKAFFIVRNTRAKSSWQFAIVKPACLSTSKVGNFFRELFRTEVFNNSSAIAMYPGQGN